MVVGPIMLLCGGAAGAQVTDALEMIGSAAVPVMTVGLGGSLMARSLAKPKKKSKTRAAARGDAMPTLSLVFACVHACCDADGDSSLPFRQPTSNLTIPPHAAGTILA